MNIRDSRLRVRRSALFVFPPPATDNAAAKDFFDPYWNVKPGRDMEIVKNCEARMIRAGFIQKR